MQLTSLVAFLLYIIIVIAIGIFSTRKSRSAAGYILGNRGLSYWVTAISANASDMSVWLFMGLPMAIYKEGLIHIWTAIGLVFFMFLNWHFIAPKLRRATEKYDSLTLPTFFDKRLGTDARALRILGALFSTVFLTIYVSAGITGMGYLFESIFGLDYVLGCTIAIFAVLTYISIGGFTAICYTDFFQGLFLLAVIITVPVLIFFNEGNSDPWVIVGTISQGFWPTDQQSFFTCLTLACGWGVGYFGQPHILNKFMAISDPNDLNKSKWIGTIWQILALAGAVAVGLAAHQFFQVPPNNAEIIFVDMVKSLFSPFFAAFILCAILAATLSTIDSQILVIASVIAEDFYAAINKKAIDKKNSFGLTPERHRHLPRGPANRTRANLLDLPISLLLLGGYGLSLWPPRHCFALFPPPHQKCRCGRHVGGWYGGAFMDFAR
jgi:sodium/proline symporter